MEHYIGVDLHKAFFQACALTALGERTWEERFPTSPEGFARFRAHIAGAPAIAVEASSATWSFADRLVEAGLPVCIVDPGKTRLKAGYAAKTDRLDARRLADALRRDSVVSIYHPPLPVRELRELCRYRGTLMRMQVMLKQRIHALLTRQGVTMPALSDLFGRAGDRWLGSVTTTARGGDALRGLRHLLESVVRQLTEAEQQVTEEAARDPIVARLDPIPGIGPVLGLTIRAEIGTIDRFPTAAHLASYAGLVPRVSQSGATCRYGRLVKHGSPWLRWALIQAAVHGPRRPDAVGRWARRLALRKGATKARPGVARALCEEVFAAWRMV